MRRIWTEFLRKWHESFARVEWKQRECGGRGPHAHVIPVSTNISSNNKRCNNITSDVLWIWRKPRQRESSQEWPRESWKCACESNCESVMFTSHNAQNIGSICMWEFFWYLCFWITELAGLRLGLLTRFSAENQSHRKHRKIPCWEICCPFISNIFWYSTQVSSCPLNDLGDSATSGLCESAPFGKSPKNSLSGFYSESRTWMFRWGQEQWSFEPDLNLALPLILHYFQDCFPQCARPWKFKSAQCPRQLPWARCHIGLLDYAAVAHVGIWNKEFCCLTTNFGEHKLKTGTETSCQARKPKVNSTSLISLTSPLSRPTAHIHWLMAMKLPRTLKWQTLRPPWKC